MIGWLQKLDDASFEYTHTFATEFRNVVVA
jgi:hypothetical protein